MSPSHLDPSPGPGYAEHTLDEVWRLDGEARLSNRRVTIGVALPSRRQEAWSIEATTDLSSPPAADLGDRLLSLAVLESHRDAILDRIGRLHRALSIRVVLSHRLDGANESLTSLIRLEAADEAGLPFALLTTPRHLTEDIERLEGLLCRPAEVDRRDLETLPLLWGLGTGGVLLHESAGHPAGVVPAVDWPHWLRVIDDPGVASFEIPIGEAPRARRADLLASEAPRSRRRASFREHPMARMSTLVATAEDAPFELPDRHVEIELAEGGSWDPLSERVELRVLIASLVEGERRSRLAPFVITAERRTIAQSLKGSRGPAVRYPGVLCSEQGQRVPVGTFAPDLITEGI